MDALQAVSTAVGALIALVALGAAIPGYVIARRTLDSINRTREGQLLTDISRRWEEGKIFEARCLLIKFWPADGRELANELRKLRSKGDPEFLTYMSVPNFFEDVGILVEEEAIPFHLVKASLGRVVLVHWRMFAAYLHAELAADPTLYVSFPKLVKRLTLEE